MCFSNLGKGDGKQEIGIYGREKMFMRKKENELQIDWKHFYLGVLALVIPMALQNLINVGVTAADVGDAGARRRRQRCPDLLLQGRCSIL